MSIPRNERQVASTLSRERGMDRLEHKDSIVDLK